MKLLILILMIPFNVLGVIGQVRTACFIHNASDCDLVKAVVKKESNFKSVGKVLDVNGRYSYGPMQIQCPTARLMGFTGKCSLLKKPSVSIAYGIKYLEYQLSRYNGDMRLAVGAYNSGTAIICSRVHPDRCIPGQLWNRAYWLDVKRMYLWLKKEKLSPALLYVSRYKNKGGLETFLTEFKSGYPTFLGVYRGVSLD